MIPSAVRGWFLELLKVVAGYAPGVRTSKSGLYFKGGKRNTVIFFDCVSFGLGQMEEKEILERWTSVRGYEMMSEMIKEMNQVGVITFLIVRKIQSCLRNKMKL